MDCDNENHIDFEKEVEEFTKFNYVEKIEIISNQTDQCEMIFTTLEKNVLHLKCCTQEGIIVLPDSKPCLEQTRFESFDILLSQYSPLYNQKFNNDLINKLQILAQNQVEDEN
ncbi:hypothetical protein TTHERM_00780470 (macronuclear) [Tetrahymena thermophila SB210]|uniref:GSKIP domain-containing protein n=1 Tax=Tetrahymena thermophila (strain SB210) TaxID=312017 RepID=I7MAR8_TETTS|nr:hypothetical protein TTHERM_00780470 [Tetrahymena thermophila SB210]EAS05958.2 hypothetical protein TTHERM_00780470 [Tetrahymena thermophila SB210]|eukprot:XP_001026203.2 hypothetical protein TTHERM_00780470 [Tetrahymena thermophila SB210]